MTKQRTITLTGRPPVQIVEADWPIVAAGDGDSWGTGGDYSRYNQALGQGQLDEYTLRVRQHADGRSIVYAVFDAAPAWTGSTDYRGGRLLDCDDDQARAIREVGEEATLPDEVIRDCIADLPAEVLS